MITCKLAYFDTDVFQKMCETKAEYVHASKFGVKDKVVVDGCGGLVAVVTGILIKETMVMYQVSWFHNGDSRNDHIEEYRLTLDER